MVQNAVQMNSANPSELADAMRKMEECLQVFAQISGGKPTANQMQGNQMTNQMANQLARIEANRSEVNVCGQNTRVSKHLRPTSVERCKKNTS